jgi:transposase-like protein
MTIRPSLDPDIRKRALAMVAEGVPINDIKERLHIARATIEKWVQEPVVKVKNLTPPPYAKGFKYPGGRGRAPW